MKRVSTAVQLPISTEFTWMTTTMLLRFNARKEGMTPVNDRTKALYAWFSVFRYLFTFWMLWLSLMMFYCSVRIFISEVRIDTLYVKVFLNKHLQQNYAWKTKLRRNQKHSNQFLRRRWSTKYDMISKCRPMSGPPQVSLNSTGATEFFLWVWQLVKGFLFPFKVSVISSG